MGGRRRWNGKAGSSEGGRGGSVLSLPPPSGGFSRNDDLLPPPTPPITHSLTLGVFQQKPAQHRVDVRVVETYRLFNKL